jgi:hypothetical protein
MSPNPPGPPRSIVPAAPPPPTMSRGVAVVIFEFKLKYDE